MIDHWVKVALRALGLSDSQLLYPLYQIVFQSLTLSLNQFLISVTSFCEISPIWQNLNALGNFAGFVQLLAKFRNYFAKNVLQILGIGVVNMFKC